MRRTVQRVEAQLLEADAGTRGVVVERHIEAVVAPAVLVQRPAADDAQVGQRDVVEEVGDDQDVAGHLADVSEEGEVGVDAVDEDDLEVAVDIRTVGVHGAVLVDVAAAVSQTRVRAAAHCNTRYTLIYEHPAV